jgi:hypothetical protein
MAGITSESRGSTRRPTGHCGADGDRRGEEFDQEPSGQVHYDGKILREKGADGQG